MTNLITYLSVALTIFFGYLSIRYAKKSKVLVNLSLKKDECYTLFKTNIKDLKIDIKYKGETIDNPLILFRGTIVNSGTKDISKSSIYKPLKIVVSKDFKWLEFNIKNKPENAEVGYNLDSENSIQLDWDLLKRNESIEFESLLERSGESKTSDESAITDEFYDNITFDFRITDLEKVEKQGTSDQARRANRRIGLIIGIVILMMGVIVFFLEDMGGKFLKSRLSLETEYNVVDKIDSTRVTYKITPVSQNSIILANDSIKKEFRVNEFNSKYSIDGINRIKRNLNYFFQKGMGVLVILFGIYILIKRSKLDFK